MTHEKTPLNVRFHMCGYECAVAWPASNGGPFLIRTSPSSESSAGIRIHERRAHTSVLDMSEQLFVCQTVTKCMTQTMRKALIKMCISCPNISLSHTHSHLNGNTSVYCGDCSQSSFAVCDKDS